MKVLLSAERYLSIRFRNWSIKYFKSKEAFLASCILVTLITLANLHVPITFAYVAEINGTSQTYCYYNPAYPSTLWMNIYNKIHLLLYSAIPFILIFISNILLITFLMKMNSRNVNNNPNNNARRSRTNKTIITMTITFILMTLPGAICSFYYSELTNLSYGSFTILFFDCVTFSYHCLNFWFLYFTNHVYKNELLKLLKINFKISSFSIKNTSDSKT